MNADRWGRVQLAFEAVLAGLASPSTVDTDLREEIEQLLEQDALAEREGFLTPPPPPPSLIGTRLGPYEVGELVGVGGMGEVYRAVRRDDYRQEVAIKVVCQGLAGREGRERFRAERQVLARLNHPNIARLFDGGTTPDGRPYLVMEFIPGPPLDRHGKHRPLAERLSLFRAVCLAVAHAHAAGVIHRDLKPGNILVGVDGQPRVTDFGLARHADDSGVTLAGQVLGTPSYMAPEQATGGTAGAPADVYALGAILYELLTGRPPFRGETARATIDQLLTTDPLPPRLLQPGLPADVNTICLKCLEKDQSRRYPNANELADDVGRFLAGDPIRARPVGPAERALRFSRRHPVVSSLSAALLLAVVGGFTGVTCLWLEADRQRGRAERRERLAREAANDLLRVAERTMDYLPHMSEAQLAALEKSLASFLELNRESPDETVQFKTAQAHHFVARLHNRLGRPDRAEDSYRAQLHLLAGLPAGRKVRFDTFHALLALRSCVAQQGRGGEAMALADRAMAVIRALCVDHPEEPLFADALANQCFNNGLMQSSAGNEGRAEEYFREGSAIATALVRQHPGRTAPPDFRCNVYANEVGLVGLLAARGQVAEAIEANRRAVRMARAIAAAQPGEPEYRQALATTLADLASQLASQGRRGEARPLIDEAIALMRQPVADFPSVPQFRTRLAYFYQALAWLKHEDGHDATAEFRASQSVLGKEDGGESGMYLECRLAHLAFAPVPGVADPVRARRLAAAAPNSTESVRLFHALACLEAGDPLSAFPLLRGLGTPFQLQRLVTEGLARHACRDRAGAAACLAAALRHRQARCQSGLWRHLLEKLRAAILPPGQRAKESAP